MQVKRIIIFLLIVIFCGYANQNSSAQIQFSNVWGQMNDYIVISPITGLITWGFREDMWEYHKILIPLRPEGKIIDFRFKAITTSIDEIVTVIHNLEFEGTKLPNHEDIRVWENTGYIGPENSNNLIKASKPLFILRVDNGNLYLIADTKDTFYAISEAPNGFDPFRPPIDFKFGQFNCFSYKPLYEFDIDGNVAKYQITNHVTLLSDDFVIAIVRSDQNLALYNCEYDTHVDHYYLKFELNTLREPNTISATLYRFGRGIIDNQSLLVGEIVTDQDGDKYFSGCGGQLSGIKSDSFSQYVSTSDFLEHLNEKKATLKDIGDLIWLPIYLFSNTKLLREEGRQIWEGGIKIFDVSITVDIQNPIILKTTELANTCNPVGPYTIETYTKDDVSGIQSVEIVYSENNINKPVIKMTKKGTFEGYEVYIGEIPHDKARSVNMMITYQVNIKDNAGNLSTSEQKSFMILPRPTSLYIGSDQTWKTSDQAAPGWEQTNFNDITWGNAYVLSPNDFEPDYPNKAIDYIRGEIEPNLHEYQFIWSTNGLETNEVWFRKTFNISSSTPIECAILNIGVNDDYREMYINGILIGQDFDHRPTQFAQYNVLPYLRNGTNIIAIHVKYDGVFQDPHHDNQIDPNRWLLVDLAINPVIPSLTIDFEDMNLNDWIGFKSENGFIIRPDRKILQWLYFPNAQQYKFIFRASAMGDKKKTFLKLYLDQIFRYNEIPTKISGDTYVEKEFTSFITSGKHRIDIINEGSDLLRIDWMKIEPVNISLQSPIIHIFEAEGLPIKSGGRTWGYGWILEHSNEYISTDFILNKGKYRFEIIARSFELSNLPQSSMTVNIDGAVRGTYKMQREYHYPYSFEIDDLNLGSHTLMIQNYYDVGWGAPLDIDKIIIYSISSGSVSEKITKNMVLPTDEPKDIERNNNEQKVPKEFDLTQNYPNPFNPATFINYQLPEATHVVLRIFNILGQEIMTLIDAEMPAGYHTIHWDGRDKQGNPVLSGVYLYRFQAGAFSKTMKLLLMK